MTLKIKVLKKCSLCSSNFTGAANTSFCRELKTANCSYCNKEYSYICRKRIPKSCSQSCSAILTNKNYLFVKDCKACGNTFNATLQREFCLKEFSKSCVKCSKTLTLNCNARSSKIKHCDSICSNLSDSFPFERIADYKNINDWAISFKNINGRKPTIQDVRSYFNVRNLPSFSNVDLFDCRLGKYNSRLESIVYSLLVSKLQFNEVIVRNSRPLRTINGGLLELDFYLPRLSLAIEVNDFDTHSKDFKDALTRYGENFKGPDYHNLKTELALSQLGVKLLHLWEDEILDHSRLEEILKDFLK